MRQSLLNYIYDITNASPEIFFISNILIGTIVRQWDLVGLGASSLLIIYTIEKALKRAFGTLFPTAAWIYRPAGAPDCGTFNSRYVKPMAGKRVGMPSGHSIMAFFNAVYWVFKLQTTYPPGVERGALVVGVLAMATWIAGSRVLQGCHTVAQVVVGAGIGTALAYLYRFAYAQLVFL